MAPRKNRSRRTADKLAVYKLASQRDGPRATGQRSTRSSPRTKKPTSKDFESKEANHRSKESSYHSEAPNETGTPVDKQTPSRGTNNEKTLDDLEVVPETPPPKTQSSGNKRVVAPLPIEEIRKPSKKRKSFNTPVKNDTDVFEQIPSRTAKPGDLCQAHNNKLHSEGSEYLEFGENFPGHEELTGMQSTSRVPSASKSNFLKRIETQCIREELETATAAKEKASTLREGVLRSLGTEHSVPFGLTVPSADINMITTSSMTLSRMFASLQEHLTAEVEASHRKQIGEIEKMKEVIRSSLISEMRNIQGLVNMVSNPPRANSGKQSVKKSLTAWEKKLDELTPNTQAIFSTTVFARVLSFNAPIQVVKVFSMPSLSPRHRASLAVQALLFSLQPGERKDQYAGGVGRLHSDFKFNVMQNVFYNVCKDSFGLFRLDGEGESTDLPQEKEHQIGDNKTEDCQFRVSCPSWLRYGFVGVNHISEAKKFLEAPKQSRKGKVRENPSPHDIACHGALRVYRLLRSHLHQARENVRNTFFQCLGYLLVPWNLHVKDIDQSSMQMKVSEFDIERELQHDIDLKKVPDTQTCPFNAEQRTLNEANMKNKKLLKELFNAWPSMIIAVQHDVHVVCGSGAQRKHSGGEKRRIYRLINLIDVACEVCTEYCRVSSTELFLRTHRAALRCVIIFAMLFQALLAEYMSQKSENSISDLNDVKVHETTLKDFTPGLNSQKSLLESKCLRLTEKEFEILNHPPEFVEQGFNDGSEPELMFDASHIQESEELGIATL